MYYWKQEQILYTTVIQFTTGTFFMAHGVCKMYPVYLRSYQTVFSSLWQLIPSSQNAQARQQAIQVTEQTRETAAERSASDT